MYSWSLWESSSSSLTFFKNIPETQFLLFKNLLNGILQKCTIDTYIMILESEAAPNILSWSATKVQLQREFCISFSFRFFYWQQLCLLHWLILRRVGRNQRALEHTLSPESYYSFLHWTPLWVSGKNRMLRQPLKHWRKCSPSQQVWLEMELR